MNRLTSRARALLITAICAIAIALVPPQRAHADPIGDGILASILGLLTSAYVWVQEYMVKIYLHDDSGGVAQQVAANTIGVQSALQANAATHVEATNVQTQKMLDFDYKSIFGSFTSAAYGSNGIIVGSNAPYACRRQANAGILAQGRQMITQWEAQSAQIQARHDAGFGSATGATVQMQKDVATYGTASLSLDWLGKDKLSSADMDNAFRSIDYATNPNPPPAPPANASSPASQEYAIEYTRFQQEMKVPQQVLAHQASLRGSIPGDTTNRSYIGIVNAMGQSGVEDPVHPIALQAKTPAGIQRDMALSLQAILAIDTERLKTEQSTAAMTAMMMSRQLQLQAEELRKKYSKAVVAD